MIRACPGLDPGSGVSAVFVIAGLTRNPVVAQHWIPDVETPDLIRGRDDKLLVWDDKLLVRDDKLLVLDDNCLSCTTTAGSAMTA